MITDFTTYHREYWPKRRAKVLAFLGECCVKCGSDQQLEIDHIEPAKKSFHVGTNMSLTAKVKKELVKCQLLCKSCHQAKTIAQKPPFTHGTLYGFWTKKCQCEVCLAAKALYYVQRNAKRRKPRVAQLA